MALGNYFFVPLFKDHGNNTVPKTFSYRVIRVISGVILGLDVNCQS